MPHMDIHPLAHPPPVPDLINKMAEVASGRESSGVYIRLLLSSELSAAADEVMGLLRDIYSSIPGVVLLSPPEARRRKLSMLKYPLLAVHLGVFQLREERWPLIPYTQAPPHSSPAERICPTGSELTTLTLLTSSPTWRMRPWLRSTPWTRSSPGWRESELTSPFRSSRRYDCSSPARCPFTEQSPPPSFDTSLSPYAWATRCLTLDTPTGSPQHPRQRCVTLQRTQTRSAASRSLWCGGLRSSLPTRIRR